ncbi:MAG: hypothetical protein SGPRY_010752, partial [Prymnesium sp.]
MDAWDDPQFEVPALEEVEEAYIPPRQPDVDQPDSPHDRPVLLLDLAGFASQLGEHSPECYQTLRGRVLSALQSDFERRSSELLSSGLCFHTMRSCATEEREQREAARAGAFMTVIEYPEQVNGLSVDEMWEAVVQPTEWECLDE